MSGDRKRTANSLSAPPAALIVTAIEGIDETAAALAAELNITVEVAATRAAALRLLGRRSWAAVILDQILADTDPEGAALVWKSSGTAIPLQLNFALAGSVRLEREIRAALARRHREQQLAGAAAAAAIDADLKDAITGLLLESQLALAEPGISPPIENRLRAIAAMAGRLRDRLGSGPTETTTPVPLLTAPK